MFDKLKQKVFSSTREPRVLDIPPPGQINDNRIIYQSRSNYGVNFGSLFVLEKYIYGSLFSAGGDVEFDAVTNQVNSTGVDDAAKRLSDHYDAYLNKVDWGWLKSVGCTAIRLPVGYWHINNGALMSSDQKFYSLKDVYAKAAPWNRVKQVIAKANDNSIGVLIDLHALPGGANTEEHSGEQSGGTATFSGNSSYVSSVTKTMIPFMVQDLQSNENMVGIQIVNEADFDNDGSKEKSYYTKAVAKVRSVSGTWPIFISDGWWPQQFSDWAQSSNLYPDVVIDSHVYRCFSDSDKSKSVPQIIQDLPGSVQYDQTKADFVVGEFSCVLDQQSWNKTSGDHNTLVKQYGNTQTQLFTKEASVGWFFWTLQFEYGDGGEWGFVPMVNEGAIPKRPTSWNKPSDSDVQKIITDHVNYWADKGGDKMEHWRFEDGLKNTLLDIESFVAFNNSLLGRTCAWKHNRRAQYVRQKGDSQYMWEWDQGFDQALSNFNHY